MSEAAGRKSPIRFVDYVRQLAPEVVFTHLLCGNGQTTRKIVSASTIREAAGAFARPDRVLQRFGALSREQKMACALTYLCGWSGYGCESLSGFEDKLLGSFLVYAAVLPGGRWCYVGFDEFAETLKEPCVKLLLACCGGIERREEPMPSLPWSCLNDIAVIAGLAASGVLRLTKSGTIPKQTASLLARLLHSGGGTSSLAMQSLLLEYGLRRGLLTLRDNAYGTNHVAMVKWFRVPLRRRHDELLAFGAAYTGGWRLPYMLEVLGRSTTWMSLNRFPSSVRPLLCRAVGLLAYAGMAQVEAKKQDLVFGARKPLWETARNGAEDTATPVILADFTAIVPAETQPENLYWFLRMGTLSGFDRIYRGSIDKKTINESLYRGIRPAELTDRLERWRAPANVTESVKEWIREFSRLSLSEETILISSDANVTQQIERLPAVRQYIEPIAAHRVFRVRPFARCNLEETLMSLGFDPRTPLFVSDEEAAESEDAWADFLEAFPEPITRFVSPPHSASVIHHPKSGKYGAELKALDINEMVHVLEYAILMNYEVRLFYGGSPGIRAGEYRIRPLSIDRGPVLAVTGQTLRSATPRRFLLKEIQKVGVGEA